MARAKDKWKCPGCKRVFAVADATDLVLCPECRIDPDIRTRKVSTSGSTRWKVADYSFVVIGSAVLFGIAWLVGSSVWKAVPKFDPNRILVEKWLKEHLEDGRWEEVKWFPAVTLQGLRDSNQLHIIESMERAKEAFEKGEWGTEDEMVLLQKYYHKFCESGVRSFCAMKFRVTTLNGQGKTLRSQVFELANGEAKPVSGNNIMEIPPSPVSRFVRVPHIYDGLRYFEDREYDPFPAISTASFDDRATAAMIWKSPSPAPEKPAEAVAAIKPQSQAQPQSQALLVQPMPQPIPVGMPPQPMPKPRVIAAKLPDPDSIPPKIREYFDRAMSARSDELKKLEKRLTDFKSRFDVSTKPAERSVLTHRIQTTEDSITELKVTGCTAFIPDRPEVGDIGLFQAIEVVEVANEETLLARWLPNGKGRSPKIDIVISPIDAKKRKRNEPSGEPELFRITATKSEPSDLLKDIKIDGKSPVLVVEPVQSDDVEQWRDDYERSLKEKK